MTLSQALTRPTPCAPPLARAPRRRPPRARRPACRSKRHRIATLQRQRLARLGRARDLERQVLEDRADPAHLLGIALRQLALAEIERVLEPDPDIAAHDRAH